MSANTNNTLRYFLQRKHTANLQNNNNETNKTQNKTKIKNCEAKQLKDICQKLKLWVVDSGKVE